MDEPGDREAKQRGIRKREGESDDSTMTRQCKSHENIEKSI